MKAFIKNNQNKLSLFLVCIIALLLGSIIFYINSTSNILGHSYRDIYFYLIEALRFSGYNISGYAYVNYLSPLIPFLTSILFKIGFVTESSIFLVTIIFYIFSIIGLYFLLNLRFNNTYSILGSVIYACFSINIMWAGNGSIDIPCICLSIWALYFFIKAMNTNQKYFYIALPLCILSFFAKYIGALIIAVIILYFLSQKDILKNIKKYIKNIIGGLIVSIILLIPFFYFYISNNIPLGFINQAQEISSTTTQSAISIRHHRGNNLFYYFTNMPRFIYNPNHYVSYILIIIAIIGIIFALYKFYKILTNNNSNKFHFLQNKIKLSKNITYLLLVLSIIGMLISFFIAGKVSFVICESIFYFSILIFSIILNEIITKYNGEHKLLSFDIAMIGWFMGYIIFFSAHLTKADRYATAFAPPLAFFIAYGIKTICDKIPKKNIREIIPFICVILLVLIALGYLTVNKHDTLVDNEQDVVEWLEINNPNISSINIASDRGPIYTWYLQKEVKYITGDNGTLLSEELTKNNIEYYISQNHNLSIPNYPEVEEFGKVTIYQRIS